MVESEDNSPGDLDLFFDFDLFLLPDRGLLSRLRCLLTLDFSWLQWPEISRSWPSLGQDSGHEGRASEGPGIVDQK